MIQIKSLDDLKRAMEDGELQSPLKAIKAKCLDCSVYQTNEVKCCPDESCPLHPFRFGKNPFRKVKELSEEELAAKREWMKRLRDKKFGENH